MGLGSCIPFHLRRLKVLDGAGIESAEQAVAKERYAGRLTVDALVEKVGHNFWEHVRELDLSRSKIRELEGLQGAEFVNLRELNLDSNLLRSSPLYLPYISPISPLYLPYITPISRLQPAQVQARVRVRVRVRVRERARVRVRVRVRARARVRVTARVRVRVGSP